MYAYSLFAKHQLGIEPNSDYVPDSYEKSNEGIHYHLDYLTPYATLKDFRANIHACMLKPLIYVSLSLHAVLRALESVVIGVVKLLTLDVSNAAKNIVPAGKAIKKSIEYGILAVLSAFDSLARLMTHCVATMFAVISPAHASPYDVEQLDQNIPSPEASVSS